MLIDPLTPMVKKATLHQPPVFRGSNPCGGHSSSFSELVPGGHALQRRSAGLERLATYKSSEQHVSTSDKNLWIRWSQVGCKQGDLPGNGPLEEGK